jgi:hypothetical protein
MLVLGIISVVTGVLGGTAGLCCAPLAILPLIGLVLGIMAWVMSRADLRKMEAGTMDPEGKGLAQGGLVCGIIGTILDGLAVLAGLAMLVYILFIFSAVKMTPTPAPTAPPVAPKPAPQPAPPKADPNQGAFLPHGAGPNRNCFPS